jgi:integrase
MATVRERTTAGGNRSFAVLFRHNGKQRSRTFDNRRAAERFAKLVDAIGPTAALERAEVAAGALTLDELAGRFFDWKAVRVRSDRTVADYRRDYANWISPALGQRVAAGITEADVQALVDSMTGRLAPKSVLDRHALLHGIYRWATAPSRRLVPHNPVVGTDLPKARKSRPKGLRPAEWQAIYAALRQIDPHAADLAAFLLATGWRWSEGAALSAYDVEDTGTVMHVTMGQVLRRNAAGQLVIVAEAKSDAGLRRIKLDAETAQMVRRRLDRVIGNDLVFTNRTGRQWHYGNFLTRAWHKACQAAGFTKPYPGPHSMRHTHVAWMMAGGKVSLAEMQRRIGHETISTTIDVYGRMIDDVSVEALEAFAALRGSPLRALPSGG